MDARPRPSAPAQPRPRRRALWTLAALAPLLLLASLVQPRAQDHSLLLDVAGQPVDAVGALQARWQRLARDCSAVQRPAAGSAAWIEARQVLAAHSPPASHGARPLQLLQSASDDWLLAEVVWDGAGAQPPSAPDGTQPVPAPLDPAIVPLRRVDGVLQVQTAGVWSGDTGPWKAPVFIRRWLQRQLPAMPAALALCLDPQWPAFAGAGSLPAAAGSRQAAAGLGLASASLPAPPAPPAHVRL